MAKTMASFSYTPVDLRNRNNHKEYPVIRNVYKNRNRILKYSASVSHQQNSFSKYCSNSSLLEIRLQLPMLQLPSLQLPRLHLPRLPGNALNVMGPGVVTVVVW